MIDGWRQYAALLGGLFFMIPMFLFIDSLAGGDGVGASIAGVFAGLGLGFLRIAGLPGRTR